MESQSLGKILKEARKEKGFTLRELSEKSGVSHSYISQLENERNSNPTPLFLKRIADALSIPFTVLAALTEGKSKIGNDEMVYLQELEKEAEQAIETLNMIWAGKNENYKLVLESISEESHLKLLDILSDDRPLKYKNLELSPEDKKRILDMLEVLFPDSERSV